MNRDLETLVEQVSTNVSNRDMMNEDWEKGTAVNGLISTGKEAYLTEARDIIDRAIDTQTSDGKFNFDDPKSWLHGESPHRSECEPATLGHGVLEFYERTGEDRYLEAVRRQYEYLIEDANRTEDGGISNTTGPAELWVDTLYMICPLFARYGAVAGESAAFDEAVKQIEVQAKHLQDPHTNLFRHEWRECPDTFPESSLWARGNGWAATGMIDTLQHLPRDHPGRESVISLLDKQLEAILSCQDESGFWHHILDYPDSPLETSATLQYTYAFRHGLELGVLEDGRYLDAAKRGINACKGMIDEDGRVRRVAVPPGGPDAPLGVTSYGQGWFLMAAERFV